MSDWNSIADHISRATGNPFSPREPHNIGGGCINRTLRLQDQHRSYFVKLNSADLLHMFEAEADGLAEIAATDTIRVPLPICWGTAADEAYLVLEYIALGAGGDAAVAGHQLANLHRTTRERFGWHRDNTIGSTPQPNNPSRDWVEFWCDQRLGFQLQLAARKGHGGKLQRRGERLLALCPALLNHAPQPSLLHGDLWGGNIAYDQAGEPLIFDPAVYYGDREADIAMTELFGGFGGRFYAAYNESWPLDNGYPTRKTLYNLYHVLNHLNLFGGGYGAQALGMIDRLLAQLGH
jgi:fructosamine-3-kinase